MEPEMKRSAYPRDLRKTTSFPKTGAAPRQAISGSPSCEHPNGRNQRKIPPKILMENYFSSATLSRRCLKKAVQDFESQRFGFREGPRL
jgi:hypothetical protein